MGIIKVSWSLMCIFRFTCDGMINIRTAVSVNYILFNKNTYKTLHSDIHRKGLENKCKTLIQIPL